jgi:uncharacterized protein YqeY
MNLKNRIQDDVKTAMRARDKQRLAALRLVTASIKQKEVDERIEVDDTAVLMILDKMVKQRRDSIEQYDKAGREDLSEQEHFELKVLADYMPEPLGEAELAEIIRHAIEASGATSMRDMGAVMGRIRPAVQGRADMKAVSNAVRASLNT